MWRRQLPVAVRTAVANQQLNDTNFETIMDLADNVYAATLQPPKVAAAAARDDESALSLDAFKRNKGQGQKRNNGAKNNNGNAGTQSQGTAKPPTRHTDNAPEGSCFNHVTYGKSAWFCLSPGTCPWKAYWVPRPNNNKKQ